MRCTLTTALVGTLMGCAAQPARTLAAESVSGAPRAVARTQTLTVDDVVELRSVGAVALSPMRRQVAYVLRTPRSALEPPGYARSVIWVADLDTRRTRRFTVADGSSRSPRWSPDGRWLAFTSKRRGDEVAQAYRIAFDGGEPQRLTDHETGVHGIQWSPDGKSLAFLAQRVDSDQEMDAQDEGRDWKVGDVRGTADRLWILDVASRSTQAVTSRDWHVERFRWSPASDRFLIQASKRADVDAVMMYSGLYIASRGEGKLTQLTKTSGKLGSFDWSPDGLNIVYLGASALSDPTAGVVYVVPAKGGQARPLTRDFAGTGQRIRWPTHNAIVLLAEQGTKTTIITVDPKTAKRRTLGKDLPACSGFDIDSKGSFAVCSGSTAQHPRELFAGGLGRGSLERITFSNPKLSHKRLGEQTVFRWKAKDGLDLEGVLVKPVDYTPGQRYPLAVLPHGGPEGVSLDGWGTRAGYPVQLFATHGFVVFQPNYRGSRGRGVDFGKADHNDLGGKEFTDVLAGIDALIAQGIVDPQRVGMGGWSYGGYFSGLAATMHSERFKAVMVGAAITNWISFTGTTEIEHENSLVHWNLWPYEHYDKVWERSPMAHAAKSKTATLVVHGQEDTRVPPEQGVQLYRALRHFGTRAELVIYPREGHGLAERAHQVDFARRFIGWFNEHVKG